MKTKIIILLIFTSVSLAALDTVNKRAGSIGNLMRPIYPVSNGVIDANDRGQVIGIYPAGSVGGPSPPASPGGATAGIASRNFDKFTMQKRTQGNYVYASVVLLIAIIGYEVTGKFERKSKC